MGSCPTRPTSYSPFWILVLWTPGRHLLAVATTAGTVRIWKLRPSPPAYGEALTSNFDSD